MNTQDDLGARKLIFEKELPMKTISLYVLVVFFLAITSAFAEDTLAKITNGELHIAELAFWQVLEVLEELVTQHYHTILVALAVISMVVSNLATLFAKDSDVSDIAAALASAFSLCGACSATTMTGICVGIIAPFPAGIASMYVYGDDKVRYWSFSGIFYLIVGLALIV